jgi:hypothetical protein
METDSSSAASFRRTGLSMPVSGLIRCVVLATVVSIFLLAAVLMARRLAGALTTPLDAEALLLTGSLLAATAAITRLAWQVLPKAQRTVGASWTVWVLPSLALLAFVVALSLPGSPVGALRAFWVILAVEEAISLWLVWRRLDTADATLDQPSAESTAAPATTTAGGEEHVDEPGLPAISSVGGREIRVDPPQQPSPHIIPPNVSQQLTRAIGDDGCEVLYGLLRGHFAPGQRSLRLHVSFCPPFEVVPEVSVDKIEGPELTVRVGQVLPYGARLDLRLKTLHADPADVVLELFVREERRDM